MCFCSISNQYCGKSKLQGGSDLKPKLMLSDNGEAIFVDGELKVKVEKDDKKKC